MEQKISKKKLVSELVENGIVLEVMQLQQLYGWLTTDKDSIDDKWQLICSAARSRDSVAVMSLPSV